jgi:hypothetical protein
MGATRQDIARMFLRQAEGPILGGLVLGTATAFALGRVVDSLLFGPPRTTVRSHQPLIRLRRAAYASPPDR